MAKNKQLTAGQLLHELNDYISPNCNKKIEEIRLFFDQLVEKFPLTGRYWKIYIEHEMKFREYEKVEKLFQRCLIKVRHIELWRCYLNYIKETKGSLPTFREKMGQAYEFALDKIGIDFSSYPIWNDYVQFLKNVEAVGSYAINQKITAVRRVYQRGVVNPMINIESFWKDYISYEQSINQMIAEKMISDRSRDYMNARRVTKEYEAFTKGLNRNFPATLPNSRSEDVKQAELWKKYIQWEISNPLRTEDQNLVIKRVVFAYEQCLLCMCHYPNIWHEYAFYLETNSKLLSEKGDVNISKQLQEDTASVYERAISTLMKQNMLIHFAYADFEESRNKKDKAADIYNHLLKNKDDEKLDPTLVYIHYIKFSRRTEGIKAARLAFKKAREDPRTGAQIYTFAALMEYYCSKDKNVASKIFELGLKKHGDDPNYILSYIDFLSHLNEENNTRVLFERVLSSSMLNSENSMPIWNKFLEFESAIGDLTSIIKVEKRRAQVVEKLYNKNNICETALILDRYKFQDLLPSSVQELKAIGYFNLKLTNNITNNLYNNLNQQSNNASLKEEKNDDLVQEEPTFKPDTSQMIPFKPIKNPTPNAHIVPGGIFPPPPAVGQLLSILPHPISFNGPFVIVDELIALFNLINLPDQYNPNLMSVIPGSLSPGQQPSLKLFDTAIKASLNNAINLNGNSNSSLFGSNSPNINDLDKIKQKRSLDGDEDEVEDENSNSNPVNLDIYRKRQFQKRIK